LKVAGTTLRSWVAGRPYPNPYVKKAKKQLTIRLDEDTIEYFRGLAEESGIPYQSLINLYLRECAAEKRKLHMKWAS
jgi:uncharacterized protein (DUF4415 family)